jgi:hypothetical protein
MSGAKSSLRKRLFASRAAYAARYLLYGRFARMQHVTEGLLSPAVYKLIYERFRAAPDLDTIEVGGAAGSASIAVAWAKIESGHASKHIVIEKLRGGSRHRFGGFEENLARFNRHLALFGAAGRVALFPHDLTLDNGPEVIAMVETPRIGGFISDADGRIDRDFSLFLPLVHPDGVIVVDDYHPTRSWKHVLTWRLLNQMVDWRLFELDEVRHGTAFGRRHAQADIARIDPQACADIIASVKRDFRGSATRLPGFLLDEPA